MSFTFLCQRCGAAGRHWIDACSFCGKELREVKKLIAGPLVYICNECVGLCNDILAETDEPPTPDLGVVAASSEPGDLPP